MIVVVVVVVGRDDGEDAILLEVVLKVDATEEDVEGRSVDEVDGKVDDGGIVLDVRARQGQAMGGERGLTALGKTVALMWTLCLRRRW